MSCTQYGVETRDYFRENTDLSSEAQAILIEGQVRGDDAAVWPTGATAVLNCTTALLWVSSDPAPDVDEDGIEAMFAEQFATVTLQTDPLGLGSDDRILEARDAAIAGRD